MHKVNGRYEVYGNPITRRQSRAADRWQQMFVRKFAYDPDQPYHLEVRDNPYLGEALGLRDVVRVDGPPAAGGLEHLTDNGVLISTIRMGFGHYRIAMAGASAAKAMGFTPYWLDLLSIPGITSEVIDWCNTWYSRWSRISQRSGAFDRWVWEPVTTGDPTLPGLSTLLNTWIVGWPWRFLKTNVKDHKMSELFADLHRALPAELPTLTAHMWNCMGAVSGGMTNVVDMMFDNWPMAFQLTEGAKHGVQSPAGYYGFRAMRGFDERDRILAPVPSEAIHFTGHHVDHELVDNIEVDCAARMERMRAGEPRRLLLTMGGAGAQRELFMAVIDHLLPRLRDGSVALLVNLGDHASNYDWLREQLGADIELAQTHFDWEDTQAFATALADGEARGLHVFLHDNIFHAVYATNLLMRVVDVMITKPSELAFYPVPKIFNPRVGGHERWGAVRAAELGDGTVEARTVPQTLQAIDLLVDADDLLELYCEQIVRNKAVGTYDGAYRCVELATGRTFTR